LINIFTNCLNGEFEYYSNEKGRELLNKSLPCNNINFRGFPGKAQGGPAIGRVYVLKKKHSFSSDI